MGQWGGVRGKRGRGGYQITFTSAFFKVKDIKLRWGQQFFRGGGIKLHSWTAAKTLTSAFFKVKGIKLRWGEQFLRGEDIKLHPCAAAKARSQQFSRLKISDYVEGSNFGEEVVSGYTNAHLQKRAVSNFQG